jgi:hypothetical protein
VRCSDCQGEDSESTTGGFGRALHPVSCSDRLLPLSAKVKLRYRDWFSYVVRVQILTLPVAVAAVLREGSRPVDNGC